MTRRNETRAMIATALVAAITDVGATRAAAARWIGVDARTVRRWAYGEKPVCLEAVLSSPRLGSAFMARLGGKDIACAAREGAQDG